MFSDGFLGTSAPFYMDLVTIYFALLPFLLFIAIRKAVKGDYVTHYKMQLATFVVTLLVVVIFEIGVRISGGFMAFMQNSAANYTAMVIFLIVHVLVAIVSVVIWSALLYGATKRYKVEKKEIQTSHKKVGQFVFLGLSLTSIMGVLIYYFLFVYTV
jgi:putative membrane protein